MRVLTNFDAQAIERQRTAGEFFWLDLTGPDPETIHTLGGLLHLHPLAQEDSITMGQRPKLDRYAEHLFLVLCGAELSTGGTPATVESHLYITDEFLVTIHSRELGAIAGARENAADLAPDAGGELVFHLLDALTDSFRPVVESFEERIDQLDEQALREPRESMADEIVGIRRRVSELRRVARPQWELVVRERKTLQQLPGTRAEIAEYLADVIDHLNMLTDDLEMQRERIAGVLDLYYTALSHHFNSVGERLSLIGTLLLPVTLVTGFFGMNFGWMLAHLRSPAAFLGYGVGGTILATLLAYAILRRQVDGPRGPGSGQDDPSHRARA